MYDAKGFQLGTTVAEIKKLLQHADEQEFAVLERSLVADSRKGVREAVEVARRRLEQQREEKLRLERLYTFQQSVCEQFGAQCAVGLDEVGRGPVAGPLAVGAVVLPSAPRIEGLNDSKQLTASQRVRCAKEIKQIALYYTVQFVSAHDIDSYGISACLKKAFSQAVSELEQQGAAIDLILLDGNPLHLDNREVNFVKGDSRCASIAAASIIAKVERDALMDSYAKEYPQYGFDSNKGYGSAQHIQAIRKYGLSPIHRVSFCTSFTQQSLF